MSTQQAGREWYLLYTKSRQEVMARMQLERQGYTTYLPMIKYRRKLRARTGEVVEPMFPRYLFIHLNTSTDNWGPIRSTLGVSKVVSFGMMPAKLPDNLISIIKQRCDDEGVIQLLERRVSIGDVVRIEEGPFLGYEGVFIARTGKERIVLLLDIVGNPARVEIPEKYVLF